MRPHAQKLERVVGNVQKMERGVGNTQKVERVVGIGFQPGLDPSKVRNDRCLSLAMIKFFHIVH